MYDWRAYARTHLIGLRASPEREHEIINEIAGQLENAYSDALSSGLSEADAVAQAKSQIQDWEQLSRAINDAERPQPPLEPPPPRSRFWSGASYDARHALRFLRRNPALATIAIAMLACGIGAITAIFTIVDAIAMRDLPYEHADRLMSIETRKESQPEIEPWTSALDLADFRRQTRAFSKVAGISPVWNVVMTGRGAAQNIESLYVSGDFFPILGVHAVLGRALSPEDDRPGVRTAVLSHGFWQKQFGASRDAIGKTITLDNSAYTIAGVLPANFRYLGDPLNGTATEIDLWLPLAANQLSDSPRGLRFLKLIGQRNAAISTGRANQDAAGVGRSLARQFADSNRGFVMNAWPLADRISGNSHTTLLLLLGAVGFVLLMVCTNVAHLLLAKAVSSEKDLSVRIALGASRYRLARQMLAEGGILALIGGALGIGLSMVLLRFLIAVGPAALLQMRNIRIDFRALLFTAAVAAFSALLSGLPPAWRVARSEIGLALRQGSRNLTAGHHRLRSALVIVQVALALTLLIGAGLLIHSFIRLLDVDPGFEARHVLAVSTQLPAGSGTPEKRIAMYRAIHDQLVTIPGVVDVAAVSRLPLLGSNLGSWLFREDTSRAGEQPPDVEYRGATANYFATMGIPLRKGHFYNDHDGANPVAVIDETAAARFWPGEDPVGKRIKLGSNARDLPWLTIVGVAGRVRHTGLAIDPPPHVYRPVEQRPLSAPILVIRTAGDPAHWINSVTQKIHAVSQDLPVYNVYPMEALVERSTAQRRFVMLLLVAFGGVALLLAVAGIYGTVSQSVAQRTREIGLRMALGASPAAALRLVMSESSHLIGMGILAGATTAFVLTRFMRSMLFDIHMLDPIVFLAAAAILIAAAMLACYAPARRATRVDPAVTLRQ